MGPQGRRTDYDSAMYSEKTSQNVGRIANNQSIASSDMKGQKQTTALATTQGGSAI